jgi:hypothetical protein
MAGPTIATVNVDVEFDQKAAIAQAKRIGDKAGDAMGDGIGKGGGEGGNKFADSFDKSMSGRFKRIGKKIDNQLLDAFDGAGKGSGDAFSGGFGGSVFAGMDRTVALVIKLIAAVGPQLAALGSALSANLVALTSSALLGLGGALTSLAGPAVAAGLAMALAVSGFKEMRESIPGLQSNIDKLGDSWDKQAKAFGSQWGPALKTFLGQLREAMDASTFGTALGRSLAEVTAAFGSILSSPGFTAFRTALETTFPAALTSFGKGLAAFAAGLLQIFASAGPLAVDLGDSFLSMGQRFSDAVTTMASDGRLEAFFTRAGDSFHALMDVFGPLSSGLANVFLAGQDSGDRLLGILAGLAQKFEDWTTSIGGQNALATWFSQAEGIFGELMGVVGTLGTTLADLVTPATLGNVQDFLVALQELLPAVGDILAAVGSADLLNVFAQGLIGVTTAIAPLLPLITTLAGVIADLDPGVIQALGAAFAVFFAGLKIAQLTALIGGIKLFATIILELRTAPTIIAAVRGAWIALSAAFGISPIGLIIIAIAALVAGLVLFFTKTETGKKIVAATWEAIQVAVKAVSEWFTNVFLPGMLHVWESITNGVKAVGDFFASVWQGVLDAPQNVVNWFQGTFVPFMQSLPGMLLDALIAYVQFWISLPGRIIGALLSLIAFLIQFGADVITALITAVTEGVPKFLKFFQELPGNVVEALSAFGGALGQWFTDAWNGMVALVVALVTAYIDFWLKLPQRVIDAVTTLGPMLGTFFTNLWNTLRANVSSGIDTVLQFFRDLPGKISSALGSLLGTVGRIFTDAMGEGNKAALDGIGKLLATMGKVPAQILSAVGNLASTLYNAGRDVVQGLVNGVASMAGAVGREVNKIISGLSAGVKKLLGISSPSKVFADIGRNVMLGLQGGITMNASGPLSAMDSLVGSLANRVGPLGNVGFGGGVSGANTNAGSSGRTLSVASGAIVVNVPTDNPEQAANAVLDRLVARWK